MVYGHGEDRGLLMLLRLGVLTGAQIIIKRSSLFTLFIITLLYLKFLAQMNLIFINISKTNYLLINHLKCTTPDTEQIVILILNYLIIQKRKKSYLYQVIPIWNSYQILLKIALPSFHSKVKLNTTCWHPNLSNV